MFFNCLDCHKVVPIIGSVEKKCPLCGSENGETLTNERFDEGFQAGAFYNINPKTGKRAKKLR